MVNDPHDHRLRRNLLDSEQGARGVPFLHHENAFANPHANHVEGDDFAPFFDAVEREATNEEELVAAKLPCR